MATAIQMMGTAGSRAVIFGGNFSGGFTRQDELKLEAQAEALRAMGVDAVGLSVDDSRLGQGAISSLNRLSGERAVSASLASSDLKEFASSVTKGPFVITSISSDPNTLAANLRETPLTSAQALSPLIQEARIAKMTLVVMTDGDERSARALANQFPEIGIIQYRTTGTPAKAPIKEGSVWLVSPGEQGKHLIRIQVRNGKPVDYAVADLGPEYKDGKEVASIYRDYLDRITKENLLDKVPRIRNLTFAGSKACSTCHRAEYRIWSKTAHASALKTLETDGHGRDPDCVSCHVVGLDSTGGFTSRKQTPFLADVGCESCHGSGQTHTESPKKFPMPKVGSKACMSCHVVEHSPGFDFAKYWKKIKH
jgi:hypothetical protein